jgi:hypothetical protein
MVKPIEKSSDLIGNRTRSLPACNAVPQPSIFLTSVQLPVACVIEVTINTVYATLFIYYPLLEDFLFIATCFGSVEPSAGNIHMILPKLLYLQQNRIPIKDNSI